MSQSSSSSCRAASTDIPDPLPPLLPIVHRFWLVLRATSRILTELLYICSSCLSYFCSAIWGGPLQYITYIYIYIYIYIWECIPVICRWLIIMMAGLERLTTMSSFKRFLQVDNYLINNPSGINYLSRLTLRTYYHMICSCLVLKISFASILNIKSAWEKSFFFGDYHY